VIEDVPQLVADFRNLIGMAELDELRTRPADLRCAAPGRGAVGIQGMILDAMDAERITRADASRLLDLVNARLRPNSAGLSVVTESGDLVRMT
jgi:hypothetical protein